MLNGVDLRARHALAEQIAEDSWEAQLSVGVAAQPAAATAPEDCERKLRRDAPGLIVFMSGSLPRVTAVIGSIG